MEHWHACKLAEPLDDLVGVRETVWVSLYVRAQRDIDGGKQ